MESVQGCSDGDSQGGARAPRNALIRTGSMRIKVPLGDLLGTKNKGFLEWQKDPGSCIKKREVQVPPIPGTARNQEDERSVVGEEGRRNTTLQ